MSIPREVQERIEAKRQAVEAAQRAFDIATKRKDAAEATLREAEIELRVWTEAAELLQKPGGSFHRPTTVAAVTGETDGPRVRVRRRLSEPWKKVMAEFAKVYPFPIQLNRVEEICGEAGIEANADTIRGQMHLYRTRGWLTSDGPGRYKITQLGAEIAGVPLGRPRPSGEEPPENETADDSQSSAADPVS